MAVYANITADQGTSFSASVVVTDANGVDAADLTGFTAQAQARRTYTSTGSFPFSEETLFDQIQIAQYSLSGRCRCSWC